MWHSFGQMPTSPAIPEDDPALPTELETLASLLRCRLQVIADSTSRAAAPEAHFQRLQQVGTDIFAAHEHLTGRISGRLEHFLKGCSYDKALVLIEAGVDACRR